ncbi:PAS domain-containing hybrid sensor histidine kinase/response regulator [Pseudodesulfovibrio sp.]|uniref:hybrid sensor histidine kinase/response regulator n=1 Tax=Pseudodesulfovibrio sp. TaxID=2035812 RepID=UPI00261D9E4F|nr:PAS domain-containing hybrid sensor histidine kinase/response regulator [Pseudodesulfovibrio sp.]MDD3311666.1 ATP-binding protein [Pseudodesulfovibrio sp.]
MLIRSRLSASVCVAAVLLSVSCLLSYYIVNVFSGSIATLTELRHRKEQLLLKELSILSAVHREVLESGHPGAADVAASYRNLDGMAKDFYDSLRELAGDASVDQASLHDVSRSFHAVFVFSKRLLHSIDEDQLTPDAVRHLSRIQGELSDRLKVLYERSNEALEARLSAMQRRLNALALLALALVVLSGGGLLYVFSATGRHLITPLTELARTIVRYKVDRTARVECKGSDEVAMVGVIFNQVADELDNREIELLETRRELMRIFDNSWEGIARLSPGGGFLLVSPSLLRLFQYGEEERDDLMAANFAALFVDPGQWAALVRALEDGEPRVSLEAEFRKRDGRRFWGRVRASRTVLASGEAAVDVYLADVTSEVVKKQLVMAKEFAEAASEAKTQFLAVMSHEIRTPLFAVLGMVEVLEDTPTDPTQDRCIETLRAAGSQLQSVIDNILDFSRIESGRVEVVSEPFDFAEVCRDLDLLFTPLCRPKGLRLACRVAPGLTPKRIGDAGKIRQVMVNLVSNAIKYTNEGAIEVDILPSGEAGGDVVISVRDTGIGVAGEHLESIFDPFTQEDRSTTRAFGGAGLGLAITQRLVRAMGGDISVASEVDEGSVFKVRLPLAEAGGGRRAPEPAAGPEAAEPFAGRTFLIADDAEENRLILRMFLERTGCRLVEVEEGDRAVEMACADRYDLILMDIEMPGVDGLEATRRIRVHEAATGRPRTPIVILTAHSFDEFRKHSFSAGCDHFLAKPFTKASLRKLLAEALATPET